MKAVWRLMAVLAALSSLAPASAQNDNAPIRIVNVPLIAWVASRAHALPETLQGFQSEPVRMNQVRDLVYALADRNWLQADELAKDMKYYLVAIRHENGLYVVASDGSSTGRDPVIVVNTEAQRDLIVEAPHVPFESGTGEQAVVLLTRLKGRAALIAGAHRCPA